MNGLFWETPAPQSSLPQVVSSIVRERLPFKRPTTHYAIDLATSEGRLKFHLSCSTYPDGRLGEISVSHGKAGAVVRTMLTTWARMTSIALQNGAPVANIVYTLSDIKDATGGRLRFEQLPEVDQQQCTSLWDAIAKVLAAEYTNPPLT